MSAMRFVTKEKASVEIYGRSGRMFAALKNLSRTGALLEYVLEEIPVKRGDLLRITVDLPGLKKRHHVSAEVVWRTGKRTGVNFLNSDELLDRMVGKEIA